jgi:hypothetical protein
MPLDRGDAHIATAAARVRVRPAPLLSLPRTMKEA